MNLTLAALLGLGLGQAPAADYYPLNSRNLKLPIEYKDKDRKAIRQVRLFVSTDQGNVWNQVAEVPPDRNEFVYAAPKDGVYWFNYQIIDLKGRPDVPNLTAEPPAMKALIDTTPPQVRFTNAKRTDTSVVVEWVIEDQYPDDTKTKVFFRAAGSEGYWQEVTIHPSSRNGVEFPVGTPGPVVVKVAVHDLAGNKTEGTRDVPGAGSNTHVSASLSPGNTSAPTAPAAPPTRDIPPPMDLSAGGPVAPTGGPLAPAAPPTPAAGVAPQPPANPPTTPVVAAAQPPHPGYAVNPTPPMVQPNAVVMQPPPAPAPTGPAPAAVFQGAPSPAALPRPEYPPSGPVPAAAHTPAAHGNTSAVAVFSGQQHSPPRPTVEVSRLKSVRSLQFDLSYQVEQQGPSGVSRVDLWVTRDDGQNWVKWSQHSGRDTAIRVALDARQNPQPEGLYGFRLVPVSGAGLSDREPARGDAPDLRVIVDLTPPVIEWYEPTSDAVSADVLVLRWRATDANFADDPITIEWSEHRTGPWVSVAAGTGDVIPATATAGPTAARLPNTGQYSWRVPMGVPPRVHFRITARDAAGNVQTGVTDPTLIDLAKPRAKIGDIIISQPAGRP